jgi:hypothetical protein
MPSNLSEKETVEWLIKLQEEFTYTTHYYVITTEAMMRGIEAAEKIGALIFIPLFKRVVPTTAMFEFASRDPFLLTMLLGSYD